MTDTAAALAGIVPAGSVSTDAADLDAHRHDMSPAALVRRRSGRLDTSVDCVVRPESADEVAALLTWAHETHTPITPYGAGSGVCGAVAPSGGVVVDMRRMNRIVEIDEQSLLVTAEAGITGPELTTALAAAGLTLGHEPQSIDISTLGGWIATRACGQLSARYGGIEDRVVALEAVLPGGRRLAGRVAPRRSAGPDVAALMIGSEGTLGIVTRATLRAAPVPSERVSLARRFEHMADGVAACRTLAQSELHPSVVRLLDREDTALFFRSHPEHAHGCVLILAFEGDEASSRAARAASLLGGEAAPDEIAALWWERRNHAVGDFASIMAGEGILGAHGIVDTMEIAGSWSRLRDLYHSIKNALSPLALVVGCHLSHVYSDGACLYFTMAAAPAGDDEAAALVEQWWDAGMSACLAAGGSISHHHGIGRLKARWLPEELAGWHGVLVAIKRAVDPHGIMNPGALGL